METTSITGCEYWVLEDVNPKKMAKAKRCAVKPARMVKYKDYPYRIAVCEQCFLSGYGKLHNESRPWHELPIEPNI